MSEINLLPWRIRQKIEAKNKFIIWVVGNFAFTITFAYIMHMRMNYLYDNQLLRNAYLQDEIMKCNIRIKEITRIKKLSSSIRVHLEKIYFLQKNTVSIIHFFDDIPKIIPGESYLNGIEKNDNKIILSGCAKHHHDVMKIMRKINKNKWLLKSKITEIKKDGNKNEKYNKFKLNIDMKFYGQ